MNNLSNPEQYNSLFQTDFLVEEFADRRAKVFDKMDNDSLAVLQSAPPPGYLKSFRQANEFYYLCGVELPYSYLLLDNQNRKTILFLPERNEQKERSEGPNLNSDNVDLVKKLTGVDEVRKTNLLPKYLENATKIYLSHRYANPKPEFDVFAQPTWKSYFIDQIKDLVPDAEIEDLSPIISLLRVIKSDTEIDIMRKAGKITALAVTEAMKFTEPGIKEYELGAIADYIYRINGAQGGAYPAIIASGSNAWHGHYSRNNCELKNGELVLMDYAPDYKYYTSDIGRMFPINGKYNDWQRELYGFIVEYHKVLLKLIKPDVMASDILEEAAKEMKKVIEKTDFSKPCYEKAARQALEFRGHLSHTVGLEVHDGGNYHLSPLVSGIVFSVDPQMWIPEEKLYIRVEDTIVVTDDGIEILTKSAPLELDEVEATMKEDGLGNAKVKV